ncbi:MAG: hypothetical protein BV456_10875 [Thermoplasmata archaeon M8B2D]|nr:MAG: hypothetical protein BV456_10875 [Thermoplasmata archaeon M8B2D]
MGYRFGQLSVVLMIWNRNYNNRLFHFLTTLGKFQSIKPAEIIVVDTSNRRDIQESIEDDVLRSDNSSVLLIRKAMDFPHKALALNIGIRATDSSSNYILTTDVDMVFPQNWIENSFNYVGEDTLVLSEPSKLPQEFNKELPKINWNGINWGKLYNLSVPWGKAGGPGNGQILPRDWLFDVRGYNEIFKEGQDAYDMDMWRRAKKAGLNIRWWGRRWNQFLHLWHPISEWKGKNHKYVNAQYNKNDPDVIVNKDNWGEF